MKNFCHARLVKATLLLFSFLLFAKISNAQCTLGKGDIVFTGYDLIDDQENGLNPAKGLNDRFSFVILRDVTVNTEIFFTDLGWTNQGKFQTRDRAKTDGVIRWKADTNYPAGTEITVNSKFNPSADKGLVSGVLENYETDVELPGLPSEYMSLAEISGDQIFAFTGNYLNNPTLLASISINTTWSNTLEESETSSGKSMLPGVLSSDAQNLSISRVDPNDSGMRDAYTARLNSLGSVTGTAAAIVDIVNSFSNWQLSNPATPYDEFVTLTNGNTFNLSLPVITSQPVDVSNICFAGATFFEVIADATACSFQWQILNTNTSLWENLVNGGVYTNVSTSKLMISNVSGLNGKKFRVRVYGTGLTLSSEVSISFPLALAITTLSIPDAAKNVNYNQQLNQTGGKAAYTYSMNSGSVLPAGMTLSGAGLLGGSPTVDGTYNFTIKVTDGCGTEDLQAFTLYITPEPLLTSLSVPASGLYKSGENLDFTVNYDAAVVVNNTPILGITIGSSNVNASYLSGSGTSSLKFRYTVQVGDLDANGITITGIALNGGTIKSFSGSNANNTLQNVGSTALINIDGVIPVINSVISSTPNGSYNLGNVISIDVAFSEIVTVTGTPQLSLETGITDRTVNYASGSGTNSLTFNYFVQSGDNSADLDYTSTSAMDLNGGTIRDNAGNSAIISLPAPGAAGSLAANKNLVIDAQLPTVLSLTSTTSNGSYKIGDAINITLNMSEAVTVTGTPTLSLNSGGTASYASGSGTSTLSFTYTVATNDGAADLDYADVNSLSLAGGTIKDVVTNSAVLTLPATGSANSIGGQKNIIIDGIIPLIAGTAVPANGTYVEGNNLDFVINFSEAVTLNSAGGTPYISLTLNTGGSVSANYISGSGSSSLTFRYSVVSGNQDSDGITLSNSITLNGGTISDAVGNNAVVSGINFASTASILVDAIVPTAAIMLAATDLKAGETSMLIITFSEAITGFTSADLSVANATVSSLITNNGGITWTATVIPTSNIEDASNRIFLDNTGLMDLAGNAGRGITQSSNYAIDTKIPTVLSLTSTTSNGTYKIGDAINITINLSEAVTLTGTPTLRLNSGGIASYASGSGTSTLSFNYTVATNDGAADLDYADVNSLNLAGGTIKDAATNSAILTLPATGSANSIGGQKNIIIDGIIPLIASASLPANGTYVEGNNLDFLINFSEAVTLNSAGGTPYISLTLNTGGSVSANYISGSGSSSLTFRYSVVSGNQDSDGITLSNSITLNGGTISDAVGNNAVVSGINFASTASILVDAIVPTATIVLADSDLKAGETSMLTITFSEAITGFTSADLLIANATISSLNTSDGGITWTATLTPTPNIEEANNIILLDNTGVMDLAGNAGRGTTQSSNYAINTKIPTLINTTLASNNVDPALAKTGDLITLSLTASETINTPIITIAGHLITPIGRGNSYTATYTMGENDLEGIISFSISFSNLAGNNGIPVSQTSNNSTITFDRTAPVSPVGLVASKGDKQLELTWTANQEMDIKTYNVYGGTTANPNTLLQRVSSTSTSYVHTGLTNGLTYHYRISAQDITGNESPLTADVSAIPAEAQTITFNALPVKTYGDPDFNAAAMASSGLAINYSSDNELVAKVNPNGIIQIIGAGSAKITASVPENIAFLDAPAQTQLLRVNKKDITVALNALPLISKVYNGDNIATLASANYSLTGLKSGDQISVSGTITYDDKNVGTGKLLTGSDFILLGAKKDNYNLITSRVNTIGDVTQKALTITAKDQQKIYGELLTFVGSEFSSDGLVAGDAISSLSFSSSGASANAIVGANYGILPASANGIGLNNYNISYISGTLLVAKKNLVISAENKTRFAGTENPTFTLTYEGFVNGQDQSIFSPVPEAITLATSGSTIGEYAITIKPVVALNYNIIYRPGILKIIPGAPKALSLASEVFFENSPIGSLVGTMSSESDDTNATFTYSLVSGAGDSDNSLFSISANKLLSLAELDFERKSTYSIRVSSTTQYGFSLEKILSINLSDVNEAPSLAVISNQAICYSTALQQINLSGINAGPESNRQTVAVSVSTNSTLFSELSVNNNGILRYRVNEGKSGIATIKVIVKDNGGTDNGGVDSFSREFTISVNPLPEILLSSDKGNSISKGETIRLTATGGSSYTWRNAFGIISGQQSATLTIRPAETATYFVTVTTAAGCVSEQQITVEVNHDYRLLKATNILTPNGDGVNDRFLISNIDLYPNNTVRIFDRFGRTLFTKSNYLDEWDGTFQGSGLPEDTYFYIVDFGPGKIKMKGFISLVQGR